MEELKVNTIIGIDPGGAGGIAVQEPDGRVRVVKMPRDIADLRDFLTHYRDNYAPIVFLEKLNVRPDDVFVEGDKAALGKLYRVQKMVANFEHLKAIIEAVGVPYILVHPMSWQAKLKLRVPGSGEEKRERKRRFARTAAEWYPNTRVTLWNADALLILSFGKWALENDLKWVRSNLPKREHDKLF